MKITQVSFLGHNSTEVEFAVNYVNANLDNPVEKVERWAKAFDEKSLEERAKYKKTLRNRFEKVAQNIATDPSQSEDQIAANCQNLAMYIAINNIA